MNDVIEVLYNLKDDEKATFLLRFFKTGRGEYGYGDKFLGIKVPIQRQIARKYYKDISIEDIIMLLHNQYHEVRLTSLFMLRLKFEKGNKDIQKEIYEKYLNNTKYINNWDLVDSSASYIVGRYIYENNINRDILYKLVDSDDLWKQRIAIISTFYFINKNEFDDTIKLSELLLNHEHDLIHKAVGWMLREVGKRDYDTLYNFLLKHYKNMPRMMLRYAIEHFDEEVRQKFLKH